MSVVAEPLLCSLHQSKTPTLINSLLPTMAAPAAPQICRVCGDEAAEYTCPRCNARYCSLDCYKRHSDRCTEGFYRDAAVSELSSIRAGEDEQRRMAEILQRLYQQEIEGSSSDSEEEGDAEESGLSAETLHRLLARMEASGGKLDIGAEDLSPAELAAFHRALAAGELSDAVQPWQPWWLTEDAARLELSTAGTLLVAAIVPAEQPEGQQGAGCSSAAAAGSSERAGDAPQAAAAVPVQNSTLPPPPSRPLPPLAALTKAAPSPLLRWQLLDLLYAYCFSLRLYNGDYQWEAADAADVLFALSAVLAANPALPAGGTAHSPGGSSGSDDATAGAAAVLLSCVQQACQPPVGSREGRSFAVGVLSDVAALLQLGRPVVLTALMDICRLVESAKQQLEGSSSGGNGPDAHGGSRDGGGRSKQQLKEVRRRLVAAERKLLFFMSWANEQPGELYELLALAAAGEHQKHAAALGSQASPAAGIAAGLAAQLGSVSLGQAGQQAGRQVAQGSTPSPVLIEEL